MKKKLYVPHPGHFDGLKELISAEGKDIYSIFMAGSPDYVGTGRSNLSSPQIEDIREQNLYAHKNSAKVEIVLNSSCFGGRQLTPAEKHAAQDEYSQIIKQMRRRQCRADAIGRLGEGVRRSIIGEMRKGGVWNYIAGRSKIEEMAGSSGRVYIRSLLSVYRQIVRIYELEFGYASLGDSHEVEGGYYVY